MCCYYLFLGLFFCEKVNKISTIYSELYSNILDVFDDYEVAIMTPHYNNNTPDTKVVPKEQ